MNTKPNILFTATLHSPFIQEDLRILRLRYNVIEVISSGWRTFTTYLNHLSNVEVTFSWFASVYSSVLIFFTKIFSVKSVLILGGVDVAKEQEYNYGIWNSWWKAKLVRYGITHADIVLAVDESLKHEAIRLAQYDGANISVVPTGYDSERWLPDEKKQHVVLSVGNVNDLPRLKKKGFDILFDIAAQMKDVPFIVVGIAEYLQQQLTIPGNVRCLPLVSQDELLHYYQSAKVYCQLSRHEGLPNSLCEAMLCGCIPVGSNKFGIPYAIGDTGFIVDIEHRDEIAQAIRSALTAPEEIGMSARQRIIEHFPLAKREKSLHAIIESILR